MMENVIKDLSTWVKHLYSQYLLRNNKIRVIIYYVSSVNMSYLFKLIAYI